MNRRPKVVSNKRQLARLVQLMQENADIAKGICGKIQGKSRWELIAAELNSLGPPLRSLEKWSKVWIDLKSNTKKKCSKNRAEFQATGGGPNNLQTFTATEEAIINFLSFDVCTDPPGEEMGSSRVRSQQELRRDSTPEMEETENETQGIPGTDEADETLETNEEQSVPPPRRSKNINTREKKIALLEKQMNMQEQHFKVMKRSAISIKTSAIIIKKSMINIEKYTRRSYEMKKEVVALKKEKIKLEREKLQILKEEVKDKKKNRVDKLRLKLQLLEIGKDRISNILM